MNDSRTTERIGYWKVLLGLVDAYHLWLKSDKLTVLHMLRAFLLVSRA
jgi:hypothetical protein